MEFTLRRDRISAAAATVLVEGAILYALLMGIKVVPPAAVAEAIAVFTVEPPPPAPKPPPPPPQAVKPRAKAKEGAASPKNIVSKATQIVAPKPPPYVPPPPIEATLKPDFGRVSTSGASNVRGPGTGSGGIGEGSGSGRGGSGPGGGGGGSPAVHISGRIRDADYPRQALDDRMTGTLRVMVTIEPNGRVSDCDIIRSSRSPILDETTCRLIQERYRYQPARDDYGRPVRARERQNHTWVIEERDQPPPRGW